jgi:bifunctional UDP-N-acetylglucosamine pyrophosphorylase/glucosamine-1-phosphate N-acetyltransferase
MKCVILAAGEGKRMHPMTFTRPKVMLPIANKPILEWNLLNAIDAGLKDFIFVVAYKSEMVRNHFRGGEKWNVNIEYVNQGKALGTAHAIGMVEKFVDKFIVLCGDTIFGKEDIKKILKKDNCMGLVKVEDSKSYGIVETKNDKIVKIYEKMESPFTNIINAGIYHLDKEIFHFIKKTDKSPRGEYEITDSINAMINKTDMEGVLLKQWRDVIYPWHLLDANEEISKKTSKKIVGIIEKNTTIKDAISVGKNSVIMNGTYIEGPVVIGDSCKIGPNCYIRPYTSIGNGCHIGNACEIKNSIILNDTKIPHQSYVGDSIIGENCNLGAGTKIANLRFDKKNIHILLNNEKINTERRKFGVVMGDDTQTGINSIINIGSFIGNNVFIGPGATVRGYIRPYSKIM